MHLAFLSYFYQNNDLFTSNFIFLVSLKISSLCIKFFSLGIAPLNLINQKFNDRIKILNFFFKIPSVHKF